MSEENRIEFFRLAQRYNQLGRMLPEYNDFDTDDIKEVAQARIILAEMEQTKAAMGKVLDAEWKSRGEKRPPLKW